MEENVGKVVSTEEILPDFKEKIEPEDQQPEKIRFKCSECGKILLTPQGMKKHLMNTHGTDRLFKCPQCPKTFKHSQNLTTHKKCHDESAKIVCFSCDKKFTTRGNLKKHLRTHVSSVEQLEEMWISKYTTEKTRKHMRKVERIPEQKPVVETALNVDDLLNWGSCSRSEFVVKKEELELIKNSKSSGSRVHLRLGKMMSTAIPGFMNGTLFPTYYLDSNELNFEGDDVPGLCLQRCPECNFGHTRSMLREHIGEHHPGIFDKMCFICCQKVNDMEAHEKMHREVEAAAHFNPELATLNRSILEFELSDHKSVYYQSPGAAAAELLELYKIARNGKDTLIEQQPVVDEVVQREVQTNAEVRHNPDPEQIQPMASILTETQNFSEPIAEDVGLVIEPKKEEFPDNSIVSDAFISSCDSSSDFSDSENCPPISNRLPLGRPPVPNAPPNKKRKRLFSTDSDYSDY